LNQTIYSGQAQPWQGEPLWLAINQALKQRPQKKAQEKDALILPLYP